MTAAAFSIDRLTWVLDGGANVRPFVPEDAPAMLRLITANREHLDRWLRWSNSIQTLADAVATIAQSRAQQDRGLGFHSGIWVGGDLAGGMVCRDLDPVHRTAELGYWLGADFTGRGLVSTTTARSIDYLFGTTELHRLYMRCGADNIRSRAVPERLGFVLEGILRQTYWITDARVADQAVYGLLAQQWRPPEAPQ